MAMRSALSISAGRSGWTAASAPGSDRVSKTNRQNFSDLEHLPVGLEQLWCNASRPPRTNPLACTHAHYPPDTVACDGAALNARLKAMLVMPRGPAESEACKLSWCSASLAPCVHHACFTSHRARMPRCSLACCMPPSIQTARRGSAHSRHANSSSMAAAAACSGGATAIKQASGGLPQLPYVGDLCFCVHNVTLRVLT